MLMLLTGIEAGGGGDFNRMGGFIFRSVFALMFILHGMGNIALLGGTKFTFFPMFSENKNGGL